MAVRSDSDILCRHKAVDQADPTSTASAIASLPMNVRKRAQFRQAVRLGFATAARCAFHARGERAWQRYLRTRKARPLDEVFDELDARLSAKRREVQWSFGAELAKGATAVRFPPAPEPQDWDWEPPPSNSL